MSESEPMGWVFKIIDRDAWAAWPDRSTWPGTAKDLEDGFVHLSGADQVRGTLAKHYAGRVDLLLLWIPEHALPAAALRWEPSRGGALFPHCYAPLNKDWVKRADPLPLLDDRHQLPADFSTT